MHARASRLGSARRGSLGADVSEITERGSLAGQGNKVQCTHPFTAASLSPSPPSAPLSLFLHPVPSLSLAGGIVRALSATAVASDSVSNGSGGHTILRLNSTDTAAQLRSFSSYSLSLSLLLFFSSMYSRLSSHSLSPSLSLFLGSVCLSPSLFLLDTSAIQSDTSRSFRRENVLDAVGRTRCFAAR